MRYLSCAALALGLALAQGCGPECAPEPDITVTLTPVAEEVRALPTLVSGAVTLLDGGVPDSHGTAAFEVSVENADRVVIDDIAFEQEVGGETKEVEVVRLGYDDGPFEAPADALPGGTFRFHWRMAQLADFQLEEDAAHSGKVTVQWRYAGCRTQTGEATATATGTVKAVGQQNNFVLQAAEAGRVDLLRGPKAKLTVGSNVSTDVVLGITDARFTVVFYDEGVPPVIGYGVADASEIAVQVAGQPKRTLTPTETMELYTSTDPAVGGAPYASAGEAASTNTLVGGGKAVVTLEVESQRASATSAVTDVITTLVDVP